VKEKLFKSVLTHRIFRKIGEDTIQVVSDPSEAGDTVGHPLPAGDWPLVPLTEVEFVVRWGNDQGYEKWLALNNLPLTIYHYDNDGDLIESQWMGPGSDYDDAYNNPDVACGAD
jgi:hypothetical protein